MRNQLDIADEMAVREVRDDILLCPVPDAHSRPAGLRAQGFALLRGSDAVLIDMVREAHLPALRRIRPIALVLTHRHLIDLSDALAWIVDELDVPIFLHPIDAASDEARASGLRFRDPTQSDLLAGFGLEARLFPGHTAGGVVLRWRSRGGVLCTGDCAVGPTVEQAGKGELLIQRPPTSLSDDDAVLRRSWEGYDAPAVSFLPFHGEPVMDRPDLAELLAPLRGLLPMPEFAR